MVTFVMTLIELAQAREPIHLPNSPMSASALVAMEVHAGKYRPGRVSISGPQQLSGLTCSPRPCALPNVTVSLLGGYPVNDPQLAVNPIDPNQVLVATTDYN